MERSPKQLFGLIGRKLGHSFSAKYFNDKFEKRGIDARYELFEIADIKEIKTLLKTPNLVGLNVTIPYKQTVMHYLDGLSDTAQKVGAVNTIAKTPSGWIGHNTDMPAFRQSLINFCKEEGKPLPKHALILGTGGASAAVQAALNELGIDSQLVSREPTPGKTIAYQDITEALSKTIDLIVNTTPLGMYPNMESKPAIPYQLIKSGTLALDLVYNPEETAFMNAMRAQGCPVRNGLEMLHLQAEGAWEIWQAALS